MIIRILTGLVLLGLGYTFIVLGGLPLLAATLVFALFATYELFAMLEKIGHKGYKPLGYLLITSAVIFTLAPQTAFIWLHPATKYITLALLLGFFIEFLSKRVYLHKNPLLVTLRVVLMMSATFPFFILVREGHNGLILYGFTCLMIWVVDIAALFSGRQFGKHPLSKLSPKKTWEGSILGSLVGLIAAAIFIHYAQVDTTTFMLLAIFIAIVSQVSDLHESLMKRTCGVKDSSSILPGHGGFYDRLDSALFVAPLIYFLFN